MGCFNTLLVAGCSHSFGSEIFIDQEDLRSINFTYGSYLAKKLNLNYINISSPGISNFEIAKRVQQYINFEKINYSSLLIIIGWTEPNRFTFYPNTGSKLFDLFTKNKKPICISSHIAKKFGKRKNNENTGDVFGSRLNKMKNGANFINFFDDYIFNSSLYNDLNYMVRLFTSSFLSEKNITHLTFSSMKAEKFCNTEKYENSFNKKFNILEYKDNFNFVDNFKDYGTYKGGHLKVEAHKAFSEYLHNQLIVRGLIK